MRRLLSLIAALFLFAGLANGAIGYAMELNGHGEVATACQSEHFGGDADEVPADADKNYPHHHNMCHGHELGAPFRLLDGPPARHRRSAPNPSPDHVLVSGPTSRALRPPIA